MTNEQTWCIRCDQRLPKKASKWGLSYNYFKGEEHTFKLNSISHDLFCFAFVAMHLIVLNSFKGYVSNSTPYILRCVYFSLWLEASSWSFLRYYIPYILRCLAAC